MACIIHTDTLVENLADIQERDRFDIVPADAPVGGKERARVQKTLHSSKNAYNLAEALARPFCSLHLMIQS